MQGVLRASVIALALLPVSGAAAAAESGCGSEGKPPCTVLRWSAPAAPRWTSPGWWGQECIVIVGGLGSPVDGSDASFFSTVLGHLAYSLDHRLIRFGVDRGAYDTSGAIARSGAQLRGVIRGIAHDCESIHLLAHSMGGVVVDRALSVLDPRAHGVSTYIAMATPHNGATLARALPGRSAAVHDLGRTRAPLRLPRVEHVRLRMVNDLLVLPRDHRDRRADVREFTPASPDELEGHGGIVHNDDVQVLVRATIANGSVPPRPASW